VPKNDPKLADDILELLKLSDSKLREELISTYDITDLTKPVIGKYAELTGNAAVKKLLDGDLAKYTYGRGIIDLLTEFPHAINADQLRSILRKLPPRLYSISSAQDAVGEQVDLTIAAVRYDSHGRARKGVASCYLADDVAIDGSVAIYVKPNKHFRLPVDKNAPVIMVGPGTGIAPFRAFMQQREADAAKGKNWLFFGDQHYNFDFLYQTEWQDWSESGLLTNLDVAFSRDKPQKVYVQDKMRSNRDELLQWLKEGAYFYVCGDESKMAKDVDAALREIAGDALVEAMKAQGRYLRDVY
jgi:sulfite reductase (NADPH) flavoprotein alpha-component